MKTPYNVMRRDCQNLHSFTEKDVQLFIKLAEIKKGDVILDAMAGNGAIAKELEKIKGIKLYVLDNSEFQIEDAKKNVKNAKFYVSSALKMPFTDNFFDKIFIRNGVYEIPKEKQVKLYKEILRVLKKGGLFLNWAVELNEKNQKAFQNLAREKDKIAGYEDLVKNRYFMTKKELNEDLLNAGFSYVSFFDLGIYYQLLTKKWCEIDFKGDINKANKWNNYIKSIKNVLGIDIKDLGKEGYEIKVPAMISVARK